MTRRDAGRTGRAVSRRGFLAGAGSVALASVVAACSPEPPRGGAGETTSPPSAGTRGEERPPDEPSGASREEMAQETGGPDVSLVFARDRVHRLTVTVPPASWEQVLAAQTRRFGERGAGAQGPAAPRDTDHLWAPAGVSYGGETWQTVGFRVKGDSSLQAAWNAGADTMPFKLDFDQFEDEYPQVRNQRFYGFKQLSFATNHLDPTALRETLAYELMRDAGLAAAETAFYEVHLDYGDGPASVGLYTAVEVVDDPVIPRYFGQADGNIYEAVGGAASLMSGTLDGIETGFEKKNNARAGDWSDLRELYEVLHSPDRMASPGTWRTRLEAAFDVDAFFKWLGVSALILHWDTYGWVAHNFYLYHDPESGRLTWLPWDHNLVLGAALPEWGGGPTPVSGGPPLDYAGVNHTWPLIRYLLDDPAFYERYVAWLRELRERFDARQMEARCWERAELLAPVVATIAPSEPGTQPYEASVQELVGTLHARSRALDAFLTALA